MPSLTFSQESFDEKLPSSMSKRVSRPLLQTQKVTHLSLHSSEHNVLLDSINKQINRSRKVLVLTGAGISCNAGIPDFRSSDGLYNLVKQQYPDVTIRSGQEMFDISLFREEEKISAFATFMERLYSSARLAQPTKTHRFIAHLKNRNKLLRCYTQNIDGLEEHLGLEMSSSKSDLTASFTSKWRNYDVVQLHGDLNTLSCTLCFNVYSWSRPFTRDLRRGNLPSCPRCMELNLQRSMKGKRSSGSIGILRPNIVLYGENHPSCEFIAQGLNMDIARGKPDLLLIMGTSLKVDGVKRLVKTISKQVHERGGLVVLVNKTNIGDANWHGVIDYQIMSDCDDWVDYLRTEIPGFFKTQQEMDKLRQLKREASELRKKLREEKRNLTPPNTPQKKRRIEGNSDSHDSGIKSPEKNSEKQTVINTPDEMEIKLSPRKKMTSKTNKMLLELALMDAQTKEEISQVSLNKKAIEEPRDYKKSPRKSSRLNKAQDTIELSGSSETGIEAEEEIATDVDEPANDTIEALSEEEAIIEFRKFFHPLKTISSCKV